MRKAIIFMFSGQGSQYYHMGEMLFNKNETFRKWMIRIDSIVYKEIGESILEEMYNKKKQISDKFSRLLYTHPAIFMVEYALAQVILEEGIKPDYLLGSSLGEYTCVALSGIMDLENTIQCIVKQAMIIEEYCTSGRMIAIINNPSIYYDCSILANNSELISVNYNSHFVVSCDSEKLELIERFLNERNMAYQLLPVSYGFHSSLIDKSEKKYKEFLDTKSYKKPSISYMSCLLGDLVLEVPKSFCWDVVRKPIQFQRVIQKLEMNHECVYLDLGPSGTLTNFLKNILSSTSVNRCFSIINPFNQELKNLNIIAGLHQK